MQVLKKLDPIGTILVLGFVISLLLALQFGGTEYSWSDYRTIVCFVISGVLLLVWLFVQWRQVSHLVAAHCLPLTPRISRVTRLLCHSVSSRAGLLPVRSHTLSSMAHRF